MKKTMFYLFATEYCSLYRDSQQVPQVHFSPLSTENKEQNENVLVVNQLTLKELNEKAVSFMLSPRNILKINDLTTHQ